MTSCSRLPPGLAALAALAALACSPSHAPGPTDISFADVTAEAGLPSRVAAGTLAVRDFDRDGWPDLMVSVPDASGKPRLVLYRNRGLGLFDERAAWDGSDLWAGLCTAGDLNADGYPDIACARLDGYTLLMNTGTTGFDFDRVEVRVAPPSNPSALVVADLGGTGHPELLTATYRNGIIGDYTCDERLVCTLPDPAPEPAPVGRLRPGADGWEAATFEGLPAGLTNDLEVLDWNGDGRPDLFEANDFGLDRLFVQDDGGVFHDRWPSLDASVPNNGMGVAIADFDGDGGLDAFVDEVGPAELWMSGEGKLVERAAPLGVASPMSFAIHWAALAADFDDDGDPDLFVAAPAHAKDRKDLLADISDHSAAPASANALQGDDVFENRLDRGEGFVHASVPATNRRANLGPGYVAAGDFDRDGRIDVVEIVQGFDSAQLRLLRNTSDVGARHWLGLQLEGHVPLEESAGARVTVTAGGRTLGPLFDGGRGLGLSSEVLEIGLGQATSAHVEVVLPGGRTKAFDVDRVDRVAYFDEF